MGKMPEHYNRIKELFGEFHEAHATLGKAAREAGPLEEKVSHIIQLAGAAAIASEGAVHSHARRAMEAGATPDEVRHAIIILTNTIGFPRVAAALSWVEDELK